MAVYAEKRTKAALKAAGMFGRHSVYVLGKPILDSDAQTISIAYSSEELLLNGYRQAQYGYPSIIQVDCTHRLVLEGHACMLFGTVDAAQHFHVVRRRPHPIAPCAVRAARLRPRAS